MKVKRLSELAKLPTKAHAGDLGYDLYASKAASIPVGDVVLVKTDIAIQLPEGYGALVRDRSSVSTKQQLFVTAGVIDNGYTGEILVALYNAGSVEQQVYAGHKIAQLVPIQVTNFSIEEVSNLQSTDARGSSGFGSTGK